MNKYERKGRSYSIKEVLSKRVDAKTKDHDSVVDFDGDLVKMNSERYECFEIHGTDCVHCGVEGKFFAKEKVDYATKFHFNLYAINSEGNEVLMTKARVAGPHEGGRQEINNRQTLCEPCNNAQGRKWDREIVERKRQELSENG